MKNLTNRQIEDIPHICSDIISICYKVYSEQTSWLENKNLTWQLVRKMSLEEKENLQLEWANRNHIQ